MDKRDQELLDKQLRFVVDQPQSLNIATICLIVAIFLVGVGVGDILSKSKQANTNYATVVSRIAEAAPHSPL